MTALAFYWGATTLGCWVVGLFFLRYWRLTRDRLFAYFAAAFWLLSLNWAGLTFLRPGPEARHLVYIIRVVAFLIIILAILDKNRDRNRDRPGVDR